MRVDGGGTGSDGVLLLVGEQAKLRAGEGCRGVLHLVGKQAELRAGRGQVTQCFSWGVGNKWFGSCLKYLCWTWVHKQHNCIYH